MVKFFNFIVTCLFTCIIFGACSDATESPSASEFSDKQKVERFLVSVDQQNASYVHPVTRADIPKWGGKFFSAVVDGCVGTVAGAASGGAAAWVFGTAASWLYDEYWDRNMKIVNGKDETSTPINPDSDIDTTKLSGVTISNKTILFADTAKELTFIDSIGYYHNELLSDISRLGKKYINSDNSVNYEQLCADISFNGYKRGLGLSIIDVEMQQTIRDFTIDFIKKLKPERNTDFTQSFNYARNRSLSKLSISADRIDAIKSLCEKITSVMPYLSEGDFLGYSKDLNDKIDNSDLPDSTKLDFKTLNNIIANSSIYWGTEDDNEN